MKDAPKVTLTRAQLYRAPGLNTTQKSAQGPARAFVPTWGMVCGHQNWKCLQEGRPMRHAKHPPISTEEYTRLYQQILFQVPVESWRWLWDQGLANNQQLTLLCYCQDGWFCHTHLLIEYACARWPQAFIDGRNG